MLSPVFSCSPGSTEGKLFAPELDSSSVPVLCTQRQRAARVGTTHKTAHPQIHGPIQTVHPRSQYLFQCTQGHCKCASHIDKSSEHYSLPERQPDPCNLTGVGTVVSKLPSSTTPDILRFTHLTPPHRSTKNWSSSLSLTSNCQF